MEDFHDAQIRPIGGQLVGLFGVFDGHGGSRAAEYVQKHLFDNLVNHPNFSTDPKAAIAETYKQTDQDYLMSENGQNRDAGSTASTAVLVGKKLLVANVGDSRAVMCRGGKAHDRLDLQYALAQRLKTLMPDPGNLSSAPLSSDHKPNRDDERQRIEEAGGVVMWAGTWRVGGVLAVSRAFGDRLLKRYVVAEPEIQEEMLTPEDEFLVLASDGLWDVVSNQDAVSMIQSITDAQEAAKCLTDEAFRRGSADNITCVVVRLHQAQTAADGPGPGFTHP
eukprot:SM000010S04266  [mRNA]  locus=s10:590112:592498:+ [translate_table: standard]